MPIYMDGQCSEALSGLRVFRFLRPACLPVSEGCTSCDKVRTHPNTDSSQNGIIQTRTHPTDSSQNGLILGLCTDSSQYGIIQKQTHPHTDSSKTDSSELAKSELAKTESLNSLPWDPTPNSPPLYPTLNSLPWYPKPYNLNP